MKDFSIDNDCLQGQQIFEYAPDGIFLIDFDMNIRYVNPAFCKMMGYRADEVMGTSITDHLGDISILANCMQSVQDTGSCKDQETIFRRKDGSMVHISKNVQAILDAEGNMTSIVVFIRDMTRLHLLNNKLLDSQKDLTTHVNDLEYTLETLQSTQAQLVENEKMASLGNLVAGVAHEVNTPIGISITATSYMHDTLEKLSRSFDAKTLTMSELSKTIETFREIDLILNKNLFRAAELIGSFKKVAVNQTDDIVEEFSLNETLADVFNSTNHTVKLHHAELVIKCDEPIVLYSYPGVIAQIMTNLIMNSLMHAFGPESNQPTIEISGSLNAGKVTLVFHDNGKGMDPITVQKAFEPFYTTARGKGGSGLGLNVVHSLVTQKLGGEIKIDSSIDEGCTFSITFPAKRQKVD